MIMELTTHLCPRNTLLKVFQLQKKTVLKSIFNNLTSATFPDMYFIDILLGNVTSA